MNRPTIALCTAVALLVLTSCAKSLPSEEDAQLYLKDRCFKTNKKSACISKFVSFKKTNGVQQEVMGAKAYHLEGRVTYVLTDDDYTEQYLGIGKDMKPVFKRNVVTPKGETIATDIDIMFVLTENGWRPQE